MRYFVLSSRLLGLGLAVCGFWVAGAAAAHADAIAYYDADGDAVDSVGGHDGTLVSGAGFGTGLTGQAFDLNGSSQYVSASDDGDWAFGSGDFTISVFANFDSIRQGSAGTLPNVFVGQSEGAGGTDKWVFFYDGNGSLGFHINGPSSVFLSPGTSISIGTGEWHQFAVTRSGSTFTFYLDGVSVGTATSSVSIPDSSAALTLGQAEGLGYLDGSLDEVRLFSHALSDAEIAALSPVVPEPATLALFGFGAAGLAWRRTRSRRPTA